MSFETDPSQSKPTDGVSAEAPLTPLDALLLHDSLFAFWERSERKIILMRIKSTGFGAALGTIALVATFTFTGASAANAAPKASTDSPQSAASCWADISSGQSICVGAGEDLIATVEAEAGVDISVPAGMPIGGITTSSARTAASLLKVNAVASTAATQRVVSAVYDDINYGGGTFVMTATGAGCDWGITNIATYGWNDRVSSFKSYAGCTTALFKNINFGGTKVGYATNKASLGTMNDAASSWATE